MWAQLQPYLIYVLIGLAAFAALKLFSMPTRWIVKIALNTLFGFIGLFLFNLIGSLLGLSLGLNLVNALVVGVLGLPGLVLLLLVKWLFVI